MPYLCAAKRQNQNLPRSGFGLIGFSRLIERYASQAMRQQLQCEPSDGSINELRAIVLVDDFVKVIAVTVARQDGALTGRKYSPQRLGLRGH